MKRSAWVGVMAMVAVGCSGVPGQPDGSVPNPFCTHNAGVSFPNVSTYGVVGELLELSVPSGPTSSCDASTSGLTAAVEIIDPLGNRTSGPAELTAYPVGTRAGSYFVYGVVTRLTPTSAGTWIVNVGWSSGFAQTLYVPVASLRAPVAAPVRRTYVDRMDVCAFGPPYLSSSGLAFCGRSDDRIWVYDTSGNVRTSFPGRGVVVSGSDVWSAVNADVEHRTDVAGTLRFDGAVTDTFLFARGEVRNGRFEKQVEGGVLRISWTGTALTTERVTTPVPFATQVFVVEEGRVWSQDGCYERPGCQQTDCGTVRVCAEQQAATWSLEPDAAFGVQTIWGTELATTLVMRPRPFSVTAPVAVLRLVQGTPPPDREIGDFFGSGPPDKAAIVTPRHVLIPKRVGTELGLEAVVRSGKRVVSLTDDWLLEIEDPFTVVATKLR